MADKIKSAKKSKMKEGVQLYDIVEVPRILEKKFDDISEFEIDKNVTYFTRKKLVEETQKLLAQEEGRTQDVERHTVVAETMNVELIKWQEAKTKIGAL